VELIVVTSYKRQINPFTNPNPKHVTTSTQYNIQKHERNSGEAGRKHKKGTEIAVEVRFADALSRKLGDKMRSVSILIA
jgi:hypothetical protein